MLRQNTYERLRGVPLRPESRPASDGTAVRLEETGMQVFHPRLPYRKVSIRLLGLKACVHRCFEPNIQAL
jgi:hypothetical protein